MRCDLDVMASLWAEADVICVHPGSGAIVGHDEVMRSWSHIFTNAEQPDIQYMVGKCTESDELAVHVVAEEISSAGQAATVVLATNVYQKLAQGWLMVEHHASLVQSGREKHTLQ
jgi:ketosteroid isomerase-like protein